MLDRTDPTEMKNSLGLLKLSKVLGTKVWRAFYKNEQLLKPFLASAAIMSAKISWLSILTQIKISSCSLR